MAPKVLFILKFRDIYGPYEPYGPYDEPPYSEPYGYGGGLSSGLLNSAIFVAEMLIAMGIEAKVVQVVDNNSIDKEVAEFQPTHVIIEALWVVPSKFAELIPLHPDVKWIVRMHSEIPFVAQEGVAIEWINGYVQYPQVTVAANSDTSLADFRTVVQASNPDWTAAQVESKVVPLTNYYPYAPVAKALKEPDETLDIACFGAIRPLKNQLIQAVAAIRYAELTGKTLRFHINGTRAEQGGNNILKNLVALFAATPHELVQHGWLPHGQFLDLVAEMDLLMQVSFSETFNIVTADAVVVGVPVVVSGEITWTSPAVQASTTVSDDIVDKIVVALDEASRDSLVAENQTGLMLYSVRSQDIWLNFLGA